MPKQFHTNNAASTLAAGASSGATALTLASGTGALFASPNPAASDWQILTLTNAAGTATEIVKLTARSGDVLTVVRAQEGTTALAWDIGDKVQARLTAGMLDRMLMTTGDGSAIAIRTNNPASASDSIAIGSYSSADGAHSLALGGNNHAWADSSVAIGGGLYAANAHAEKSIALSGGATWREQQFAMGCHPCIPRDDWQATYGSVYNSGMESLFASHYLELGTPATWAANYDYADGAVVRPSTPNGYQYRLWLGRWDSTLAVNTSNSGASEPSWPTGVESSVDVNAADYLDGAWIAADLSVGADETIPAGMVFYPTEIGFICFNHSGVSAAPFVSIGTAAEPTLLVNNLQLSNITGPQQRHAFTGLKHGITDIRYTLVTPATGVDARFHGRFYAKGIFIQAQG